MKIEFEADTLEQVKVFLRLKGLDGILLDNMSCQEIALAVASRNRLQSKVWLEASGGVTLETVKQFAQTGVDRIAVGEITHSAKALDLSLELEMP